MNTEIRLSYILTTYNKLPYLKEVINSLVDNCKSDEEIIIIDGDSSDGTKDYLEYQYDEGKIHEYISEKDFGEAHGFNKGLLLARGEIIKIITDDDVYDFELIQSCKNYMLANQGIDILFANIGFINNSQLESDLVFAKSYEKWFYDWKAGNVKNCFLCGLSMFIRKKSLSNIGLFDTSFRHIDFEYTVRLTSKKVNVAFCTGMMVTAVINTQSVSFAEQKVKNKEVDRVSAYYDYIYPVGVKPSLFVKRENILHRIKAKFGIVQKAKAEFFPDYNYVLCSKVKTDDLKNLYKLLLDKMNSYNKSNEIVFISKMKY